MLWPHNKTERDKYTAKNHPQTLGPRTRPHNKIIIRPHNKTKRQTTEKFNWRHTENTGRHNSRWGYQKSKILQTVSHLTAQGQMRKGRRRRERSLLECLNHWCLHLGFARRFTTPCSTFRHLAKAELLLCGDTHDSRHYLLTLVRWLEWARVVDVFTWIIDRTDTLEGKEGSRQT